jgi:hypothetical protein
MTKLVVSFRNFENSPYKTDEFTIHILFLLHLNNNVPYRKNVHTKSVDFNELFV